MTLISPKKLIEVAIPLEAINEASAKEKSIRHGHPSTLHLWWARRPLAAARAVLFAQMVNDPASKYTEEQLKEPGIKGAVTKKRNELFALMKELVQWENTTNKDLLARAHAEIVKSWEETCAANKDHPEAATLFNPKVLPAVHDPFAGGGTIPLEAQRLGLEAHASDLNPVAVLINKAMIEIPPKFAGRPPVGPVRPGEKQTKTKAPELWEGARGLAEDVRRYGAWVREEAEKRIGHLYPKVAITAEMAKERPDLAGYVGQELTVIAWLWARTVKSPNPAYADVDVPLVSSFVLASKPGKEAWVEPVVTGKSYRFEVRTGKPPAGAEDGTKLGRGANFRCVLSGSPLTPEHVKERGAARELGAKLLAVVAEGVRGRVYLSPTSAHEALAKTASPTWRPETELPNDSRNFWTPAYGLTSFGDLFTDRQLVALTTFSDLVQEVIPRVQRDALAAGYTNSEVALNDGGTGARAYGEAIATYLAFAVSKATDRNTSLCTWESGMDRVRGTFGRQALPMVWDFTETNCFAGAGGDFLGCVDSLAKPIDNSPCDAIGGSTYQLAAQSQQTSHSKVVSSDPPYYDNIGYADLSDFFYVWLRRALAPIYPDLFATLAVPKAEELVATPYRHGGKKEAEDFFLSGMTSVMHNLATLARATFPLTIYYAFKQADTKADGTNNTGWETFLQAMVDSGLGITGTWPMRTELGNRMIGSGTNALASSIVLVCRPRLPSATTIARRDFLRELQKALPKALAEMTADADAAIAPVDLAQAAIGPGMAIFSKYAKVLEADGSAMPVRGALVEINKAIDSYFAEGDGDLDGDTRFCLGWFSQYGFEEGPFGEADVLARAKSTAVDGVVEAGVAVGGKGKVRLLRVKEYPSNWDPRTDTRVPVWEACHQLCRALGESERAAGILLARMPDKAEGARALAYRLYTLCERQKRAEDARAYNELVTSWPAIVEASREIGHVGTQQRLGGVS